MKKSLAMFIVILILVMTIPKNVYASGQITPSGIAYDDIGTEIDAYVEEYEAGLASVGICVFDESGIIYEGYYGYSDAFTIEEFLYNIPHFVTGVIYGLVMVLSGNVTIPILLHILNNLPAIVLAAIYITN